MTGPVQVLVVGFDDPVTSSGELVGELARLEDAHVVRLVDVLLVSRTGDGGLEVLPPPPGAPTDAGRLTAALLGEQDDDPAGTAGERDATAWSLDDVVPEGGAAAIALVEHLWADPLVLAIRRKGGRLLEETWLAPEDVDRLERLAVPSR